MTHSESTKHRSPDARAKKTAQRGTRAKTQGQVARPTDKNRRSSRPDAPAPNGKSRGKARKAVEKVVSKSKVHLPLVAEESAGGAGRAGGHGARAQSKASCTACGLCCSYVAVEVDSPATVKQATQLLWYVYHESVSLYVNDDEWMVQFDTTCIHLQPDYRCGVYHTRPHICREFDEQDCEVNTGDDGKTFYTATEFMAHLKETRPRIYSFVSKNFAPPVEPARTRLAPFEHRFQAVLSRRKALGL